MMNIFKFSTPYGHITIKALNADKAKEKAISLYDSEVGEAVEIKNPYSMGTMREHWRRGFNGARCLAPVGSDPGRAYREGQAARWASRMPAVYLIESTNDNKGPIYQIKTAADSGWFDVDELTFSCYSKDMRRSFICQELPLLQQETEQTDGCHACPFCESTEVACYEDTMSDHRQDWDFYVTCNSCDASGPHNKVEADAIAAWNRATVLPQVVEAKTFEGKAVRAGANGIIGFDVAPASLGKSKASTPIDISALVNRFLCWKLPQTFAPDCGISFDGRKDDEWNKNKTWPIGTNLLTADEAKAMFLHCLAAVQGEKL